MGEKMEKEYGNSNANAGDRRLTPEERAARVRKMKRKRKRRLALVVTVFCLLILMIVSPIVIFAALRVRNYSLEGESPYNREEIILASGVPEGKSLLFVDVDAVKNKIEAELPYITDVKVLKKFPGTLIIRYSEAQKQFAIQISESSYAILSPSFRVIETSSVLPEGATLISGTPAVLAVKGEYVSFNGGAAEFDEGGKPLDDDSLSLLMEISNAIAENELEDINLININSPTHIYLIYNERIVLNLGDSSNISRKIALGKKVIESENQNSIYQTGVINLTVDMQAFFSEEAKKDIPELLEYFGEEKPEEEEPETDEDGNVIDEKTDEGGDSVDEEDEARASDDDKDAEEETTSESDEEDDV